MTYNELIHHTQIGATWFNLEVEKEITTNIGQQNQTDQNSSSNGSNM